MTRRDHTPDGSPSVTQVEDSGSRLAPLLSIRGLRTSLELEEGTVDVVRGLDLDIYPNEILGLVGESGCGKSMTALSVMRLVPSPPARIVGGEITFRGRNLLELRRRQMRRVRNEEISMVFQDPLTSLDPAFTIGHQLSEIARVHRDVDRATATEMALRALDRAQLPGAADRLRNYPHELSGGMRQRVMIAMALMLDPALLIADEPTTALDVTVQAQILDGLLEEEQEAEMAILLITHDLAVVAAIADRVAVMYSGEIVEQAPVDVLFEDPRHPYTQGLIRALPEVRRRKEDLYTIPGVVPPPQLPPPACLFAPRCPYAIERCWEEPPQLEKSGDRALRCYNPQPFTTGP